VAADPALGFVLFVLSLRKGLYVYQFGQFAWTHMIIVTVLMQSSCFVANVFEGLIWFVFPVAIVFFNDIAAYLCGRGLHSSTLQLNLSACCVTGGAVRGCFGGI